MHTRSVTRERVFPGVFPRLPPAFSQQIWTSASEFYTRAFHYLCPIQANGCFELKLFGHLIRDIFCLFPDLYLYIYHDDHDKHVRYISDVQCIKHFRAHILELILYSENKNVYFIYKRAFFHRLSPLLNSNYRAERGARWARARISVFNREATFNFLTNLHDS